MNKTIDPGKMTPQDMVRMFAQHLKKGLQVLIPVAILKDTITALDAWEGIKEDQIDVRPHDIKSKNPHVTLTLK